MKKLLFLLVMILAISINFSSAVFAEELIIKDNPVIHYNTDEDTEAEDKYRIAPFEFANIYDALSFANNVDSDTDDDTLRVENPDDFKDITLTLEKGDTASNINLLGDEITLSDYSNLQKITIAGENRTIYPAAGSARHFIADNANIELNLSNITFLGDGNGGILIENGNVVFDSVNFSIKLLDAGDTNDYNNNNTKNGAGVYITGSRSEVTFTNCNFTDCLAYNGGAMYIANASSVRFMDDNIFENNRAMNNGGAIAVNVTGGSFVPSFSRTRFSGANTAARGGAVSIIAGEAEFVNAAFITNSADFGGAIYTAGTANILTGTNFTTNSARRGGAIYIADSGTANLGGSSISISGNQASIYGGAVQVAGTLNITGDDTINFARNSAATGGGAIYTEERANITSSPALNFTDNTVTNGDGGALYVNANSKITFSSETTFSNNSTESGNGGALYLAGNADINLSSSAVFSGNTTRNGNGGAIYAYISSALPSGSASFEGNSAHRISDTDETIGNGGAIYIATSTSSSSRVTFGPSASCKYTFGGENAANEADVYGGAVYTVSAGIIFEGVTYTDTNTAGIGGGLVSSASGDIAINNSTISNQTAENGGAIYSNAKLEMENTEFVSNRANDDGGAIYANSSPLTMRNVYFYNNETERGNGGAAYFANSCKATLDHVTFSMNRAGFYGGAICAYGTIDINESIFANNDSPQNGGAIFYDQTSGGGDFKASYSMFQSNNAAGSDGGGALFVKSDRAVIDSCTFSKNMTSSSTATGGALHLEISGSTTGRIVNCTFTENTAEGGMGGAFALTGLVNVQSNTVTMNNIAAKGGGMYAAAGSTVTITGNIFVGNYAPQGSGKDIWSDGNMSSGGYNRVGTYGSGDGDTSWRPIAKVESDRESTSWTTATFFGSVTELQEIRIADEIAPRIGYAAGADATARSRLLVLMLSEDITLPEIDRATNVIPSNLSGRFPEFDEIGVSRRGLADRDGVNRNRPQNANGDIGSVYFQGTRSGGGNNENENYSISYVRISGIPNELLRVGQTSSLTARVYYTNGRSAYAGTAANEEPVEWTSDRPSIVYINKDTGNIIAMAATTGNTYVTITVRTKRAMSSGEYASDFGILRVTEREYSYLNTSPYFINYLRAYISDIIAYDIYLDLNNTDSSTVSASAFQNNFKSIWNVSSASQVTELTTSTPEFNKAQIYSASDGYKAAKSIGVNINFQNRNNGDLLPLVYRWDFSGNEIKEILGYDLSSVTIDNAFAETLFQTLRIDFQGTNKKFTVLGADSLVSPTEAKTYDIISLAKADGGKGLQVTLNAYLANVAASESGEAPQIVRSSGTRVLVVPDGVNDGAISGAMWAAYKTSAASDNNTPGQKPNNNQTNQDSSESSGGGGCNALSAGLLASVLALIFRKK